MRLLQRKWRHHGLGMLQSEITPFLRIHVWHPTLKADWYYQDPFRPVHDHRFDLVSQVLYGAVVDEPWHVEEVPKHQANTAVWSVVHAKEAHRRGAGEGLLHGNGLTQFLYDVRAWKKYQATYEAGDTYRIRRGQFHTTRLVTDIGMDDDYQRRRGGGLAVTLVHRSNFGEAPARVLGSRAEHGIVAFDPGKERALWEEVLTLAEAATAEVDL